MNDRPIFRALASIGLLTLMLSACRSTVVVPQPIASAAPSASPIAIAETLEPLDLKEWQGRRGGTPSGVPSTAFPCEGDAGAQAVMLIEPFCVVWRDSYSDESGYRIEIGYSGSGEQFVYHAPANQTEYRVPEQDTPAAAAACSARSSFTISVYVQRPGGDGLVGSMGMDGECANVGASASAAGNAGYGPLVQDRLRICVAAADGPLKPGALDTIRAVLLRDVATRPDFVQMNTAYFDGNEPSIEEGCPGPMTILAPEWTYAGGKGGAPYRVDAPSPYFLWIWIAKAQDVQRAFGDDFPRRTSQEQTCDGDACNEANSAIYLTPDDLNDRERIAQSLAWGLGFQQ